MLIMQTRRAVNEKTKDDNQEVVEKIDENEKKCKISNDDGVDNQTDNHQDQRSDETNNNTTTPSQPHPAQIPLVTPDEIANNLFLSTMAEETNIKGSIHPIHNSMSNLGTDGSVNSVAPRSTYSNCEKQSLSTEMDRNNVQHKEVANEIYPIISSKAEEHPSSYEGQKNVTLSSAADTTANTNNNQNDVGGTTNQLVSFDDKLSASVHERVQANNREIVNEANAQLQFGNLPISHNSSFEQNSHQQMVQIQTQGGAMQHPSLSPYCQSAPPTVTSFNTALNPNPSSPTHGSNSLYHSNYYTPYHSSYGQQFTYPQHSQHQSYDHSLPAHTDQQNQFGHPSTASMMHGQGGMEPPPIFSGGPTSATGCETDMGKVFHHHNHLPNQNQPHHYYHSSVPLPAEDLRRSASSTRLGAANYQPYTVPTQTHRSSPHSSGGGQIPTSSIFMANPDTMPDLRFNPAAMHPGASYGRLPDGKIIELFPAMMRTVQACEYCRSRKAKCTGGLPCDRCSKKKIKCEYAQLDKKRKIKTTTSEYDMSSGAARMAANRTIEQAQAQLSAKIGMKPDSNGDGGYFGDPSSASSTGRGFVNRNVRMAKSTSGLDVSWETGRRQRRSDSSIRLAIDPIGEEVDEYISAHVTFSQPRFTASVIPDKGSSTSMTKVDDSQSPQTDSTGEVGFESSIALDVTTTITETDPDEDDGDFFFESARTTYSNFPEIHTTLPTLNFDRDEDSKQNHLQTFYT